MPESLKAYKKRIASLGGQAFSEKYKGTKVVKENGSKAGKERWRKYYENKAKSELPPV
jgi:hypothetical protein